MFSFTLEKIKRDQEQDNLYNLFTQTYVDKSLNIQYTMAKNNEDMRLDLVSKRLYGGEGFIEELMQLNNILNIWNIKNGDIIYYTDLKELPYLQALEKEISDVYNKIAKPNKKTRVDPNRIKQVPPIIKPKEFKSIILDTKNKTIRINGNLS